MLAHAKLARTYWDEALMTAVHVINSSPLVPLGGDVPRRVWTGKEVSYWHLRVFDCLLYAHVAKYHRGKLDPKSWPCIFLGYSQDEFGCRLWDKKVIRSWDKVFMKEKTIVNCELMRNGLGRNRNRVDNQLGRLYL